jgi:hypothetical protein
MSYDYLQPADKPVIEGMEAEEVVYAKNQPEYIPLRTLRGSGRMVPVLSRWSPTKEQRESILNGADIYLELNTFGGPLQPIRMAISDGKLHNDWVRVCLLDQPAKQVGTKEA